MTRVAGHCKKFTLTAGVVHTVAAQALGSQGWVGAKKRFFSAFWFS